MQMRPLPGVSHLYLRTLPFTLQKVEHLKIYQIRKIHRVSWLFAKFRMRKNLHTLLNRRELSWLWTPYRTREMRGLFYEQPPGLVLLRSSAVPEPLIYTILKWFAAQPVPQDPCPS